MTEKTKLLRGKSLSFTHKLPTVGAWECVGSHGRQAVGVRSVEQADCIPLSHHAGDWLMKVTNWRRKLSAALMSGGLLVPCAAGAAPLGTNLVANPGFENVNINSSQGGYHAVEILQWNDGTKVGFAYSHDGSLDGGGMPIPDYANGGPLAGGGSFYFTSNATDGDISMPGQVTQTIDLSTGPTAAAIATGQAAFELSAFFSSYADDGDFGNVQLEFLDLSLAPIPPGPPVVISDDDTATWTQVSTSGPIPLTTFAARISVYGTPVSFGPDGYIDNVDFRVIPEPATVWLCGLGLAGAGVTLLRRRDGS